MRIASVPKTGFHYIVKDEKLFKRKLNEPHWETISSDDSWVRHIDDNLELQFLNKLFERENNLASNQFAK